jgi:hypothetical protein
MSRRKKSPTVARPSPERFEQPPAESQGRRAPEPNPPQPNKAFLAVTTVLLAVWIIFLILLAVKG